MKNLLLTATLLLTSVAFAGGREAPAVGGQRDAHGCLSAAGQSWSVLRAACVQPWDAADLKLPDPTNPQLAVYIAFSRDGKRAELLGRQRVLQRDASGYSSADGLTRLAKKGLDWKLTVARSAPIGGQRDAHGCLPSTGATWSALRGECVQVFNVADIRLQDPGNQTLGVFVLLSADKQRAELFGLGYSGGVMLSQTATGYASADGKVRLVQENGGWALR